MATFRGRDTAWIIGRGLVLFGDVIEGQVAVGNILKWPDAILVNHQSKIMGIEMATRSETDGRHTTQSGLLLESDSAHLKERPTRYQKLSVQNVEFEIIEAS